MEVTTGDLLVLGLLTGYCAAMAALTLWQTLLVHRIWRRIDKLCQTVLSSPEVQKD